MSLAHRLSGWKLDVRSDSDAEEEARAARASLNAIPGIGDINAELLYQWGFRSAEQLADANENNFEVEGISPERARQVIFAAREWVARNPTRADRHAGSFSVNLVTGRWADFATGDRGRDPISLRAYLDGSSQLAAARRLAEELGL